MYIRISEHRKMDQRFKRRRDLLQYGIYDQRAYIPWREKANIYASIRTVAATSPLEMGKWHDAWKTGQRNDTKVDAPIWHLM